jgi:competence protein ComEA
MNWKEWWNTHSRTWYESIGLSRREIIAIVVITAGVLLGGVLTYLRVPERFATQPPVQDSLERMACELAFVADSMADAQQNHQRQVRALAQVEIKADSLRNLLDSTLVKDTAHLNLLQTPTLSAPKSKKPGDMKPIDIRTASETQLRLLPTVGKVTAQKIVMYRRAMMFVHVEDLMRVKGIGVKRFAKLRPYLLEF